MTNRKLNIIVLANGSFPIGMASTNRLVSYCRGMVELGHYVKVIVLCPHEREGERILNKDVVGIYNGIEYEYASGTTIWPSTGFRRLFIIIKGLILSLLITYNTSRIMKIDALLFGSGSTKFRYIIPFYLLSRLLKTKLIREKNEYPAYVLKPQQYSNLYIFFANRYLYKFFDAFLIMTNPLMEYFKTTARRNAKMILIPMTVEPERFSKCNPIEEQEKYIAYCGYLWGNKDGVDYLVRAFKKISEKHFDTKLYLIGDISNRKEYSKLCSLVSALQLTDRVLFTGKVNRDEMPQYLCKAKVLALARPTSLQAQGGFPTKLGEYLATGKPVVVTKVGDIPKYLEDQKTAFLAEPNNVDSFADKLDFVLSNIEQANLVGLEGKKLTEGVFNYYKQSERIIEFIRDL